MFAKSVLPDGAVTTRYMGEIYASLPIDDDLRRELGRRWANTYGGVVDVISLMRDIRLHEPVITVERESRGSRIRLTASISIGSPIIGVRGWIGSALIRVMNRELDAANARLSRLGGLYYVSHAGGERRMRKAEDEAQSIMREFRTRWVMLAADIIDSGGDVIYCDGSNACGQSYSCKMHLAAAHTPQQWQYGIWISSARAYAWHTIHEISAKVREYAKAKMAANAANYEGERQPQIAAYLRMMRRLHIEANALFCREPMFLRGDDCDYAAEREAARD